MPVSASGNNCEDKQQSNVTDSLTQVQSTDTKSSNDTMYVVSSLHISS